MGERLADGRFLVADITIQKRGGGLAAFVRSLAEALSALSRFFRQTEQDYTRFNYLGEWHSHPSFSTRPSTTDVRSMQEIVGDPEVGANFAVLMIVRLSSGEMEGAASAYWPDGSCEKATLTLEGADG